MMRMVRAVKRKREMTVELMPNLSVIPMPRRETGILRQNIRNSLIDEYTIYNDELRI